VHKNRSKSFFYYAFVRLRACVCVYISMVYIHWCIYIKYVYDFSFSPILIIIQNEWRGYNRHFIPLELIFVSSLASHIWDPQKKTEKRKKNFHLNWKEFSILIEKNFLSYMLLSHFSKHPIFAHGASRTETHSSHDNQAFRTWETKEFMHFKRYAWEK